MLINPKGPDHAPRVYGGTTPLRPYYGRCAVLAEIPADSPIVLSVPINGSPTAEGHSGENGTTPYYMRAVRTPVTTAIEPGAAHIASNPAYAPYVEIIALQPQKHTSLELAKKIVKMETSARRRPGDRMVKSDSTDLPASRSF